MLALIQPLGAIAAGWGICLMLLGVRNVFVGALMVAALVLLGVGLVLG